MTRMVQVPEDFIEFVKSAPISSGVCCCGDDMETHPDPMSCGHTPVDQWHYSLSLWLDQIATLSHPEPVAQEAVAALLATPPDSDAVRARVEKLEEVLGDLLSWFDKPSEPEWRLKAGPYGADDAVEAARTALSNQGSSDSA